MDGHWEWSDSGDEPDTGDTADLGGDPGFGQGFEPGHTFGGDTGYGQGFDGHDGHDDFGGDPHGGDDLEEPLGTEHAAEAYDQSVHDGDPGHDPGSGHDPAHDPAHDPGAAFESADDGPGQHAGFDPVADHTDTGHDTGDTGDTGLDADTDAGHPAETFGSDPDLHGGGDGWHEPVFPEELHLDNPPEPVDGFPWSDADVLGAGDHSLSAAYDPSAHLDSADPADLAGYDGAGVHAGADPWSLLLGSDDPATSSLAGFWAPHN